MKKIYFTLSALILVTNLVFAKTYTLGSGRWTDATVWNTAYPGNTIKADDVVIVTGQLTINTGIVVEGTLQVEKGASMIGMKDLVILKSGTFINNGNTVMKRIVNEGTINNNLIMEAMSDIDNKGVIGNNSSLVTGSNFNNFGGNANGNSGSYFVNNNLHTSHGSTFGNDVRVMVGNQIENSEKAISPVSAFVINASYTGNTVELNIANPKNLEVAMYSIERSLDGKHYAILGMVTNRDNAGINYTDESISNNVAYYRIKAINQAGEETTLPLAAIKTPYNSALSMAK